MWMILNLQALFQEIKVVQIRYSTGWNGLDDDGDWDVWASDFGWDSG